MYEVYTTWVLYVFCRIIDDIQVFKLTELEVGNGPDSLFKYRDVGKEVTGDNRHTKPQNTSDGVADSWGEELC